MLAAPSCPTLETPWTVAHQAPLSMRFPRQGHWSGLPFPSPGGLPDPGIEPRSPALIGGFFTTEPPGKPPTNYPAYKKLTTPFSGASCLLRWPTLCGLCFSQGPPCFLRQIAFCLRNVTICQIYSLVPDLCITRSKISEQL